VKAGVHLIDRCGAQFVAPPSMSYCRGEHRLLSTIHIKPMNHTHTHFRSSILPTLPYFAFPSRQASPVAARSFVRPSVCYHACDHDILKTNQPILLNIGTSGARCDEMKRSTLGVTRTKVEGQTTPKLDLEVWRSRHCRPVLLSRDFF